jgi:hypothetical protein
MHYMYAHVANSHGHSLFPMTEVNDYFIGMFIYYKYVNKYERFKRDLFLPQRTCITYIYLCTSM